MPVPPWPDGYTTFGLIVMLSWEQDDVLRVFGLIEGNADVCVE
jgi:hypothetical protein